MFPRSETDMVIRLSVRTRRAYICAYVSLY